MAQAGAVSPARSHPFSRRGRAAGVPLIMAVTVWLCTLPLLAIVALPLLGLGPTATIAVSVLGAFLLICVVLCRTEQPAERRWEAVVAPRSQKKRR
jgi:hypothetical protein